MILIKALVGIADAMAKKVIFKPALDGGVQLVVAGQAEIGIYPASEVAGVEGLIIVGPLPGEINLEIVYGAAVATDSAAPNAASAFVKFMAAPENRFVWKEGDFEPPTNLNSNWWPDWTAVCSASRRFFFAIDRYNRSLTYTQRKVRPVSMIVKAEGPSGRAKIHSHDPKHALGLVHYLRTIGYNAWIEDTNGNDRRKGPEDSD